VCHLSRLFVKSLWDEGCKEASTEECANRRLPFKSLLRYHIMACGWNNSIRFFQHVLVNKWRSVLFRWRLLGTQLTSCALFLETLATCYYFSPGLMSFYSSNTNILFSLNKNKNDEHMRKDWKGSFPSEFIERPHSKSPPKSNSRPKTYKPPALIDVTL
jgi:hypothetical protein